MRNMNWGKRRNGGVRLLLKLNFPSLSLYSSVQCALFVKFLLGWGCGWWSKDGVALCSSSRECPHHTHHTLSLTFRF